MNVNQSTGYILFSVLFLMLICMLLTVAELSSVIAGARTIADTKQMDAFLRQGNRALIQTENQMSRGGVSCAIPVMSSLALWRQSLTWWQAHACLGNLGDMQYYYLAEPLGQDGCAEGVPRFDRLSILLFNQHFKYYLMLQSIWVTNTGLKPQCDKPLRKVQFGRQQWRKWIRRE